MKKNQQLEIIARAVIVKKDQVLLCKAKDKKWCFLPGGHVEFKEKASEALKREIREELGVSAGRVRYIGTVENIYRRDGNDFHELNLVFCVDINGKIQDKEDHIEFHWLGRIDLPKAKIYPVALKESVMAWLKDGKIFWASESKPKSR